MRATPAHAQWTPPGVITDCFRDYDADNPHPQARCEKCRRTKMCVTDEACSAICAAILGVTPPPTRPERGHWRLKFIKMPWEA